jgi:hypothetical protein
VRQNHQAEDLAVYPAQEISPARAAADAVIAANPSITLNAQQQASLDDYFRRFGRIQARDLWSDPI